ncbi:MAG: hypothetical protein EPN47_03365 [Acidobacteria bacterium]|nr:MAG: hypothetical protein EPN47_03365 [Acidobacteriota bacterium]
MRSHRQNRLPIKPQTIENAHSGEIGIKIVGQKNTFFKKRTGEVIENKGSRLKNEPERTEKRSGEVVENT